MNNYFKQSTPEEQIQAEIERAAKAYYDFTAKQGWKLAGFEREIYEKGFEFARQILCGHRLAIIDKSRERDNEAWHKSEELFEAYQAGKNDAGLIIIPLEVE